MMFVMVTLCREIVADRSVSEGMMVVSMVDLTSERLGITLEVTVDWRLLRLVESSICVGKTVRVSVESIEDSVGKMVVSTVDLREDTEVDREVRLGKTEVLRVLSRALRLAVTELGNSEISVRLDWTASICCFSMATQAAPTSMLISPKRSTSLPG